MTITKVQMLRTRLINAETRLRAARNALERADADPADVGCDLFAGLDARSLRDNDETRALNLQIREEIRAEVAKLEQEVHELQADFEAATKKLMGE